MENKDNRNKYIKKAQEYSMPLLLFFGFLLLVFYYGFKYLGNAYFLTHLNGFKELYGFSLAILSSGIFLAVLKWFQFMRFFREELQSIIGSSEFDRKLEKTVYDVLYSDEFLKKQNDDEKLKLWNRVNRSLFKSEFPEELVDKVEYKMRDLFFHNSNLSHFYKTYVITINVTLDDQDYLTIEEFCETKIVRPNESKFKFDFNYFIKKRGDEDNISSIQYEDITINGLSITTDDVEEFSAPNCQFSKKLWLELSDCKEYNLVSKILLKYNINVDYEYQFFCERFIDYLRVEVNHSDNMRVMFLPLGNEEFEDVPRTNAKLVKVYRNLLLPEKGFRLIFVKK